MRTKLAIALIMTVLLAGNAVLGQSLRGDRNAYTPPPGSAERKAVLDALRAWVAKQHRLEVIFTVQHLKIKERYAWLQVLPESKDGSRQYESISALLRKEHGRWAVVEVPCTEEENPDCVGASGFFKRLKVRFPDVPEDILPR